MNECAVWNKKLQLIYLMTDILTEIENYTDLIIFIKLISEST